MKIDLYFVQQSQEGGPWAILNEYPSHRPAGYTLEKANELVAAWKHWATNSPWPNARVPQFEFRILKVELPAVVVKPGAAEPPGSAEPK